MRLRALQRRHQIVQLFLRYTYTGIIIGLKQKFREKITEQAYNISNVKFVHRTRANITTTNMYIFFLTRENTLDVRFGIKLVYVDSKTVSVNWKKTLELRFINSDGEKV